MIMEPFNEQADALLSDLLDRAEERMVRKELCREDQADEILTVRYIEACASIIRGGVVYLPCDEISGALIFLSSVRDPRFNNWSGKRQRLCAKQLIAHTQSYFPKYRSTLALAFRHVLRSTRGHDFGVTHDGVLLLAAATLPGARSEICRELRRRGSKLALTLVPDDVLKSKLAIVLEERRIVRLIHRRNL